MVKPPPPPPVRNPSPPPPSRPRIELPSDFDIVCSDNEHFRVSKKTMYQMKTLRDLAENLEPSLFHDEPIVLDTVKGRPMRRVVEWCEKHKDDEVSSVSRTRIVAVPEWDARYLGRLTSGALFEVICAANYLDIPLLMDYACKTVANMAKGKSATEMRQIFGIRTDEEYDEAALNQPGPSTR